LLLFELGEKPNMPETEALAKFGEAHGQAMICELFRCIARWRDSLRRKSRSSWPPASIHGKISHCVMIRAHQLYVCRPHIANCDRTQYRLANRHDGVSRRVVICNQTAYESHEFFGPHSGPITGRPHQKLKLNS
jgi:hypothetical protein